MRYNKKYQALADEFAIAHSEGLWIGARYIGHYHQQLVPLGANARNWLVFEPIWCDDIPRKLGVTQYILIEGGEMCLFSSIYDLMRYGYEAEGEAIIIESKLI